MPRTRHPLGGPGQASRPFTDRDEFIAAFDAARRGIPRDRHHVLVYYGVGGIGKTALLQELRRRLREDAPWVAHAGLDLRDASARLPAAALVRLRAALRDGYGVPFPTFDIAFAAYWRLANPHLPLAKSELKLLEESEIAGEIVSIVEDIPGVGLIPKIGGVLHRMGRSATEWWRRRGQEELRNIASLDDPNAVEDWLPTFWGADVRAWLADEPNRRAVVFLDTYEALWEGRGRGERGTQPDEWIREWAGHLQGVLVVVAGREMLRWTDEDPSWKGLIDQRLVGGLAPEDADRFLRDAGVAGPEVRAAIVERSRGVPFYLDLAVDTYERIRAGEGRAPLPDEFDENLGALLGRLLHYLGIEQRAALFTLSVPETFDLERFTELMQAFSTGYPATSAGLAELRRFSFVEEPESGRYSLHALMREALAAKHDPAERARVHAHLFLRAGAALKDVNPRAITDAQRRALREATLHGMAAAEVEPFLGWYWHAEEPFDRAAEWRLLYPLREVVRAHAERTLGPEHPDTLTSVHELARLLRARGRLDEAESLYRRALEGSGRVLGPEHPDTLTSVSNLALLLWERGRPDEAERLFRRALEARERVLGPEHPHTLTSVNNLAGLLDTRGRPDEAEPLYRRALEVRERVLGPEHPHTLTSMNNLASLLEAQGEPGEAESLYRRVLEASERVLGPEHPITLSTVNNLAYLLQERGRLDEAEPLYRRALEARERVLGPEHPDTLTLVSNFATLLHDRGRLDEAEALYRRALEVRERVLGPEHPDTLTSANNLASLLEERDRQDEAEALYRRAVEGLERVLGPEHPTTEIARGNLVSLQRRRAARPTPP
ncbi:MAG TPA: tetratricopeptide repeat protein [Longimicrobiaceae bacterium]|nr:tetratricopeptide repeat protein [Longimicrobiaceae bacterium]